MRPLLDRRDRRAVSVWLATRLLIVVLSLGFSAWSVRGDLQDSFLDRWTQWDVDHFLTIAKYGYAGEPGQPKDPGLPSFFPGWPMLLRAVHVVIPDYRLAALLVSLVAGAVAMVALARIGALRAPLPVSGDEEKGGENGEERGAESSGRRGDTGLLAVLALLLSPMAVFLFAGYSETLFLALALPAWLCARRGNWAVAALCCAAAGAVRITGLFLALALIVEFLTGPHGARARRWEEAPWLAMSFTGPLAYGLYLWRRTGDPQAWQHAQEQGFGRGLVAPWTAFKTTWAAAFESHNQFTGAFRAEILAALVGVLLLVWLLVRRRWAESTYIGLQLVALLTSSFYLSIGRATLLWWPLWIGIGGLAARRPWIGVPLILLSTPFLAYEVLIFTAGSWAG